MQTVAGDFIQDDQGVKRVLMPAVEFCAVS